MTPELDVSDLSASLSFYTEVFGFAIHARRPEERFAYLTLGDAHLMLQEADGPGRRFRMASLERPFGRGINLQIAVADIEPLWDAVMAAKLDVVIPLEDRAYRQNDMQFDVRQFVVADPDGYLLRFQQQR